MGGQDAELELFRTTVNCATLLERLAPGWRLDRRGSTRRALKYRRGNPVVTRHQRADLRTCQAGPDHAISHRRAVHQRGQGDMTGQALALTRLTRGLLSTADPLTSFLPPMAVLSGGAIVAR